MGSRALNLALQASRLLPQRRSLAAPHSAHLVGIAGAGMRALADVLLGRGWSVTGSDLLPDSVSWLAERGVPVHSGHAAGHVPAEAGLVVYSDAVDRHNPERQRASELGLRQYSYPQMMGELMKARVGLAVAGTHGKSTTTALAARILIDAGLDPTVVGGGTPLGRCTGGRHGSGRQLLVEACEYRRNFLQLCPTMAVLTGIEHDHFDCFASLGDVEAAFAEFAGRLPAKGTLIVNAGCPISRRIVASVRSQVVTFGIDCGADWQAARLRHDGGQYQFDLVGPGGPIADVRLRIAGRHNVLNAVAAAALAARAGADERSIVRGLREFRGLERRLERVGQWHGSLWYDDYAHHPTEVSAALATVRQMFPNRRLWCIFQPHQQSRTLALLDEFADSLQNADRVAIAEVYSAREPGGVASGAVAARLAGRTRARGAEVLVEHELGRIAEEAGGQIAAGDILLTLGAGDIRKVWNGFTGRIRSYRAAG
ncbi:MAG TPA: UDP-N-acetylmuramate--L-alanine ligase [Pirellulales bacterium]|nr:UDP-N-acetylmuramate--L-alanine ligase [Pirellulales bacterium]